MNRKALPNLADKTARALKLGKNAGAWGIIFSAWEANEKGWTTGAWASLGVDVLVIAGTVVCPVCGVAYGATRFLLNASGVYVIDIIDAAAGKDWLKDQATDVWNSFD